MKIRLLKVLVNLELAVMGAVTMYGFPMLFVAIVYGLGEINRFMHSNGVEVGNEGLLEAIILSMCALLSFVALVPAWKISAKFAEKGLEGLANVSKWTWSCALLGLIPVAIGIADLIKDFSVRRLPFSAFALGIFFVIPLLHILLAKRRSQLGQ